ncbi:amino acid adenylation domain-containing protein [Paraburkholderia madseniana]|uniref:Amino acid adenylation domain-containing protein n=1 Tax=Paraburkholderia madseniana TaxID=2599607 RepID=A0A6N6WET4_9BURK|nr:non-ribosomal peptide synthetase/type I polyketide synthase [Paraburkholderia madseniana]KAE8758418.1 amino acid adenylation domain-containing protein [Paraburkholderia madseniana]
MKFAPFDLLPALVQATTHLYSNQTAVIFENVEYTYRDIDNGVNRIAAKLVDAGVGSGDLVALHIERSVHMLAAMLAIHRVGAAYVPLDPAYPRDRKSYIVQDSGLQCLIYDGVLNIDAPVRHTLDLSDAWFRSSESVAALDPAPVTRDDLAYVIYTSGSTGRPKGVKVHHGAVANFLHSMRKRPGLEPTDTLLAVTTPSFDISVLELFLPLLTGARIVLASRDEVADGARLAELIERHAVTVMQATPATWRMLFIAGWQGAPALKALCGGEALDASLASWLLRATGSLWNMYGPTETTVWSTCHRVMPDERSIPVGTPIDNTTLHVLDADLAPVANGETGELFIGGAGVAVGYTDDTLTQARFIKDPFSGDPHARLYRTGDLAYFLGSGELALRGRADDQVKVKGFRIELNDVQENLLGVAGVQQAAVLAITNPEGVAGLTAFVVPSRDSGLTSASLKAALGARVPDYMVPARLVFVRTLPLTPNGKIDRNALKALDHEDERADDPERFPYRTHKELIVGVVQHLLGAKTVETDTSVFDLGIDSLQANRLVAMLGKHAAIKVSVAALFEHPTIDAFAAYIERHAAGQAPSASSKPASRRRRRRSAGDDERIAVIGMAGRFPGADSVDDLWDILASGRDSVTRFSPAQDDPGITADIVSSEHYVRARGMIKDPDRFDASLFGISPNDAVVMDPQQRVFLEVAWEAMESAGYDADRFDGAVGVYAGMGNNFYYHYNVSTHPDLIRMVGEVQVEIGREKDHIATLVSHKLNLTGPSLSINTACSTGLVAVDSAVHSLLSYQCDMALAGAIELRTPQMTGQLHEPGGIFTRDGKCRPFSSDASGTMFSDGAGAVVLKRLSDAVADGDTIHGVIIGSAVNHDGLHKKSYLAPSIPGQVDVISTAQERAQISPESITYMEAHGTATPVGDPIEFEALRNVFEAATARKNFCALGSVKGNLGHPTTAAGVVGLIKVCLALTHRKIPPLVNFSDINSNIDIDNSPFYINTDLRDWPAGSTPRRAGISSFGFCGTNAHLIVEEAPLRTAANTAMRTTRPYTLLPFSAGSETALRALASRVAAREEHVAADVGYTLAVGRRRLKSKAFELRCPDGRSAADSFTLDPQASYRRGGPRATRPRLVFAFPGQGSQYVDMGADLYRHEPAFRAALDECSTILREHLGEDMRDVLFLPADANREADHDALQARLNHTRFTQPAVFCIEYALAKTLMSWGIHGDLLVGHSIGEFVAATLAGVFALPDALRLIAARGRLMGELPAGGMLSVRLPHEQLSDDLDASLSIAAINAPNLCVVAGPRVALDALKQTLDGRGVRSQPLHTSHAFHSSMMAPAVEPFLEILRAMTLRAPRVPIVSTVTGLPMTDAEAIDPLYWANHLQLPVRFSEAVSTLCKDDNVVLLEVGPRTTLCSLASMQFKREARQFAIAALSDSATDDAESLALANALGYLWLAGFELDWPAYYGEASRRVELPAYPFERKRYWIDPAATRPAAASGAGVPVAAVSAVITVSAQPEVSESAPGHTAASKEELLGQLKGILESISGEPYDDALPATSLFELGLDSLLLTPLTFMLKEKFGVTVTFRQLLGELSTLESIVDYIVEHATARLPGAKPAAVGGAVAGHADADDVALQPVQQIVVERAALSTAASLAHHESAIVTLTGAVDRDALARAIQDLYARHDALRATIAGSPARLRIADEPPGPVPIRWIDGSDASLDAIIADDARTPFSLATGPLARFSVVTLGDARLIVLISAHAAICDGWSLDVLIEQLAKRYNANLSTAPDTAAKPSQWRDFVMQQRADARGQQSSRPVGALPSTGNATAMIDVDTALTADAFNTVHRSLDIPPSLTRLIRSVGAQYQCSPFTLLLAATQLALLSHDTSREAAIDIPMAGQSLHYLPTLVGQCTNWVAIHRPAGNDNAIEAYLLDVQRSLLDAQESCLAMSGPTRDREATSSVAFIHTKRIKAADFAFTGLQAEYALNRRSHQWYDVEFHATEYPEHFVIDCSCRLAGFPAQALEPLLADFGNALDMLVSQPAEASVPGLVHAHALREKQRAPAGTATRFDEDCDLEEIL